MKRLMIGLLSLLAAGCDQASAQPAVCGKLATEFEDSNKTLASIWADGIADDSAPRETNRQMRMANERLVQSMLLDRMIATKCPLPEQLSNISYYMTPALACKTASSSWSLATITKSADVSTKEAEMKAACDRSSWKPSLTSAASGASDQ